MTKTRRCYETHAGNCYCPDTTTTYDIYAHWTSGNLRIAENVPSLASAKRLARAAYRVHRPWYTEIVSSDGTQLTASQAIGAGMLWS